MTENCWDGAFANVLRKQKESHTFILITTRGMMCVANTFIAEGRSELTGVITKNVVCGGRDVKGCEYQLQMVHRLNC